MAEKNKNLILNHIINVIFFLQNDTNQGGKLFEKFLKFSHLVIKRFIKGLCNYALFCISLIEIFSFVIDNDRNQGRRLFEKILQFSQLLIMILIKGLRGKQVFAFHVWKFHILS